MPVTENQTSLWAALLAFQADAPALHKNATNPHFKSKFISLDSLTEQVTPVLHKHGLVWTTLPTHAEVPVLRYRLTHAESGESIEGVMPLMLAKDDPQGQGSAITYARRYALLAVLNLVADEDDDGNAATAGRRKKPVKARVADAPGGAEVIARCEGIYREIAASDIGRAALPESEFREYVEKSRHDLDRLLALENFLKERLTELTPETEEQAA